MKLKGGDPPDIDNSMQDERCVLQILRRHFARYTPEMVAEICGCSPEDVLSGRPGAVRELRPRADLGDRLRGRLDAAHGRRPEHPRRVDRPAAARQHRAPGRRDPGPARSRQHPGLDRHPDALQHPPGLHPDAPPAVAPDARQVRRAERARHRRVGQPEAVHGLAAEGVVGRRRHRGERLLLRLPAAHQRRPLALRDDAEDARRGREGHVLRRAEPDGRLGQLQADAPRAGQARLARRPRLPADRVGDVLEGLARARVRRGPRAGHPDRGVLPARRRAHREGRQLHQHPAAAPVAPQGVRAAGRLPLGAALDLPPRQGDPREARRLRATRRTGRSST